MMSSPKRGRPISKHDSEEVEEIVKKYIEENPDKDEIKPYALSTYIFTDYIFKDLKEKYTQSFWRSKGQLGRDTIDKWNDILAENRKQSKKKNHGFYNTEHLINSVNGVINDTLIKKLKYNELRGRNLEKQLEQKEQKNQKLQEQIKDLKQRYHREKEKSERLETFLFDITLVSTKKRSKLDNLLDIKEPRSPLVEAILKYSLGDLNPSRFDAWLKGEYKESEEGHNVINFKKNSAFDDFPF